MKCFYICSKNDIRRDEYQSHITDCVKTFASRLIFSTTALLKCLYSRTCKNKRSHMRFIYPAAVIFENLSSKLLILIAAKWHRMLYLQRWFKLGYACAVIGVEWSKQIELSSLWNSSRKVVNKVILLEICTKRFSAGIMKFYAVPLTRTRGGRLKLYLRVPWSQDGCNCLIYRSCNTFVTMSTHLSGRGNFWGQLSLLMPLFDFISNS